MGKGRNEGAAFFYRVLLRYPFLFGRHLKFKDGMIFSFNVIFRNDSLSRDHHPTFMAAPLPQKGLFWLEISG
jgi:hypothetical protein